MTANSHFVVSADEKLAAFVELESAIRFVFTGWRDFSRTPALKTCGDSNKDLLHVLNVE